MGKKQQAATKKKQRGTGASEASGSKADEREKREKGSAKQQRRKGKKEVHLWAGDDLEVELAAVGLRIKTIEADGNCFFRSVCDQLEGDGGDHMKLRCQVMQYIEEREEEYRFFIEDDEPFHTYCKRMKKDGAWAGHLELQATSVLLQRNIAVYQAGQPVWQIKNFGEDAPTLHLSYHDGMHYNSVRNKGDYGSGPPEPLQPISGDAAAADPAAVAAAARSFGGREVDQVVSGTGCFDRQRVAAVLERCGGSVDQAIEVLIEELGQEGEDEGAATEAAAAEAAPLGPEGGGPVRGQLPAEQGGTEVEKIVATQHESFQQQQQQGSHGVGSDVAAAAGSAGTEQPAASQQQQQQEQEQGSGDCIQLELQPDPADPGRALVMLMAAAAPAAAACQQADAPGSDRGGGGGAAAAGTAAGSEAATEAGREAGKGGARKKGVKLKARAQAKTAHPSRNQRCPCGSTRKFKNCCGVGQRGAAAGTEAAGEEPSAAAAAAKQLQVLYI